MEINLSFDIAATIMITILLISWVMRKMTGGTTNRMFLRFVFINLIAVLFDIWAATLDNVGSQSITALYFAHSGFLIVYNFVTLMYVLFVVSLTDTWHKIKKNFFILFVLGAPFLTVLAALVTNPLTKKMFLVSGGYRHGEWFPLIYAQIAVYIVFVIAYMIYYRELMELARFCAAVAYIPIGVIAWLIQMAAPENHVQIVKIRPASRNHIDLTDPFYRIPQNLHGKIIPHQGIDHREITEIEHDYIHILFIVIVSFHVRRIGPVFHKLRIRVYDLLRFLSSNTHKNHTDR